MNFGYMATSSLKIVFLRRWSFFFQAEGGIRDVAVTGVQTCALPIYPSSPSRANRLASLQSGARVSQLPAEALRGSAAIRGAKATPRHSVRARSGGVHAG